MNLFQLLNIPSITENAEITKINCEEIHKYIYLIIHKLALLMTSSQMPKLDDEFAYHHHSDTFNLNKFVPILFLSNIQHEWLIQLMKNHNKNIALFTGHPSMKKIIYRLIKQLYSNKDCESQHQHFEMYDSIDDFFDFDHDFLHKARSSECEDLLIVENDIFKSTIHCLFIEEDGKRGNAACQLHPIMSSLENDILLHFGAMITTIAGVVYVCQMKIFKEQYESTIPFLEQVVQEEFENPMSVIIWPKELHMLVDDNMRKELNKSSTGHLVLPSVVQALYSLAFVHKALGNDRAYGETMYRFKDVLGRCIGEDCSFSSKIFIALCF